MLSSQYGITTITCTSFWLTTAEAANTFLCGNPSSKSAIQISVSADWSLPLRLNRLRAANLPVLLFLTSETVPYVPSPKMHSVCPLHFVWYSALYCASGNLKHLPPDCEAYSFNDDGCFSGCWRSAGGGATHPLGEGLPPFCASGLSAADPGFRRFLSGNAGARFLFRGAGSASADAACMPG